MAKIPKNLADKAMFEGFKEEETFETMFLAEEEVRPPKARIKGKEEKENLAAGFVTKELQEKIGNLLLELKLELYKEGLVDYQIKATREGKRIVLSPAPAKKKAK